MAKVSTRGGCDRVAPVLGSDEGLHTFESRLENWPHRVGSIQRLDQSLDGFGVQFANALAAPGYKGLSPGLQSAVPHRLVKFCSSDGHTQRVAVR